MELSEEETALINEEIEKVIQYLKSENFSWREIWDQGKFLEFDNQLLDSSVPDCYKKLLEKKYNGRYIFQKYGDSTYSTQTPLRYAILINEPFKHQCCFMAVRFKIAREESFYEITFNNKGDVSCIKKDGNGNLDYELTYNILKPGFLLNFKQYQVGDKGRYLIIQSDEIYLKIDKDTGIIKLLPKEIVDNKFIGSFGVSFLGKELILKECFLNMKREAKTGWYKLFYDGKNCTASYGFGENLVEYKDFNKIINNPEGINCKELIIKFVQLVYHQEHVRDEYKVFSRECCYYIDLINQMLDGVITDLKQICNEIPVNSLKEKLELTITFLTGEEELTKKRLK